MFKNIFAIFILASFFISNVNIVSAMPVENYDLVITNARIIDGTGNPWFRGSIAVKDGKIVRVGQFDNSNAKQTIDAKNQIVAPGFIDVHAHTRRNLQ